LDAGFDEVRGSGQGFGMVLRPGDVAIQAVALETERGQRSQAFRLSAKEIDKVAVFHAGTIVEKPSIEAQSQHYRAAGNDLPAITAGEFSPI
jgi:hypothetical protein